MRTSQVHASKQFYNECKKCKNDSYDTEEIIQGIEEVITTYGIESIDVNYRNEFDDDYSLKYVFKYCKPKLLQYIIYQFGFKMIDLYIIDNRNLNNNVLHYMIQELCGTTEKNAMAIIDIIYQKQYKDILQPYGLLYAYNDYMLTPIDYCRKRKFLKLTEKMEVIKYVHIHELLITECHIPYVVSHCIIEFVFVVVHAANVDLKLDQMRHFWDVIVSPMKQTQ